MDEFRIREAKKEDCEVILGLIKELAVYLKMPQGPKIDAEGLRRDGFGEDRLFRCIIAETTASRGSPVVIGYALYFTTYSTWEGRSLYLEDVYVKQEYRDRGIGRALEREVAKICLKKHYARMDWICLGSHTSSVQYYKKRGAVDLTAEKEWHLFRMKVKEMKALSNGQSKH